jgi:hypothetical protein
MKRSGSALRISLRLRQACVLLHGVEERENDILIPSDKHHPLGTCGAMGTTCFWAD